MYNRDWFWASVDDVLAAIGFLFVLVPVLGVTTRFAEPPGSVEWVVLVLLSAVAGAVYRQRGHDIGDLGGFVLAATIALFPAVVLVTALLAPVGLAGSDEGGVLIFGVAYAIAYWYAYRGGRERVRGGASETSAESA